MTQRRSIALALVLGALLAGQPVLAQEKWPNRPVKLVVPYPPGGISDWLGRHVGRILEKELGQPVVVENKPGAASNIGSDSVAKSAPDGYTILLGSSANALNMSLYKKLPYDTARDFEAVSILADVPNVLVVNPAFPTKTIAEFVDYVKKNPDRFSYASSGAGSPAHLAAEEFVRMAGLKMRHVPYKGAGPAITDVMAGHIPMMFTNVAAVLGGVESGKLRILGTGSVQRLSAMPNVPTISEAGVKNYTAGAWYGLMVPKGTPKEVVARLQHALVPVKSAASVDAIRKQGAEAIVSTPEAMAEKIKADLLSYAKLIKETGITTD